MQVYDFQIAYEALFAGEDATFNKKLCSFIKNEFSQLPDVEDLFKIEMILKGQQEPKITYLNLIFKDIGLEQTLIHTITSFLTNSSYDPFTKNRQIRSVEWTIKLAKRLRHLYPNLIESSFYSNLFAHSIIRLFLNLNFIEQPSLDKSKPRFDILFDDDSNNNKTQNRYMLHDKINQFLGDYELNNIPLRNLPSPLKVPMFSPPNPHKKNGNLIEGAYYHSIFSETVSDKMLRGILGKDKSTKKPCKFDSNRISALQFNDNSEALKSINVLQQVPWVYNEMMLKLVNKIESPKSMCEEEQKKALRETIYCKQIDGFLKLCSEVKASQFYYPWYFDYRGRIYCSKIQFSYQGEGLPRSLHLFSESKKVSDESILLKYAKEKFGLSANSNFSLTMLKKIMGKNDPKMESDFFQNLSLSSNKKIPYKEMKNHVCTFLKKCGNSRPELTFDKEKWSLLATLLEFEYYWSNEQEWRLPLPLDATCNGQQHISAIVQDNNIAKLARLFESKPDSLDLYEYIVNLTRKKLEQDPKFQSKSLIAHDLSEHIHRRNMKGAIMKIGYGAKKYTISKELISTPSVFPISLWEGQPATQKELEEVGEEFNLLSESPSSKVPEAEYFYAPHWAENGEKQNKIVKKGYYPADLKYLNNWNTKIHYENIDLHEQKRLERQVYDKIEEFSKQFDSEVMTYEQAIEHQKIRLKAEVDKNKRIEVIRLLAKHLDDLCMEQLPIKELREHFEAIYDEFVLKHPQLLSNHEDWFSYTSESVGMRISFVALKDIMGLTEKEIKLLKKEDIMGITTKQKKLLKKKQMLEKKTDEIKDIQKNQGYVHIDSYLPGIRRINYLRIPKTNHPTRGRINMNVHINELKPKRSMKSTWLPSFIHSLDATHLHLIVNRWELESLGPLVTIHDSFGMHPNSIQRFREIARETFIQLHKGEPLRQFYKQCGVEIPLHYPNNPDFDLHKVGLNIFNF
jgi:hypothetical protein